MSSRRSIFHKHDLDPGAGAAAKNGPGSLGCGGSHRRVPHRFIFHGLFFPDPRTKRIIMMGAIDNLVKGAAGQAVQNMNLMFGLPEREGLELVPMFP